MKLQEFVTETLREIVTGVKAAQQYADAQGAKINPPSRKLGELKSMRIVDASTGQLLRDVEFDVAVTFTEGTVAEGGAGIFVAGLGLGAKGKSDTSSSSVSRIRFAVPVSLPVQREGKG
jgi:hypothetical protein